MFLLHESSIQIVAPCHVTVVETLLTCVRCIFSYIGCCRRCYGMTQNHPHTLVPHPLSWLQTGHNAQEGNAGLLAPLPQLQGEARGTDYCLKIHSSFKTLRIRLGV